LFLIIPSYSQQLSDYDSLNLVFKYQVKNNFSKAFKTAKKQFDLYLDDKKRLDIYLNLSEIYLLKKENDSAKLYSNKALVLASFVKNKKIKSIILNRLSILELKTENYAQALIYSEKAYEEALSDSLFEQLSDVYFTRAKIYRKRFDNSLFFKNIRKSIDLRENYGPKFKLAESYNLIGNYIKGKQPDSAVFYLYKAREIAKISNNKYLESYVSSNLGSALLNIKKYEEAFVILKYAERLAKKVGNYSTLHYINIYLAFYYDDTNQFNKAIEHYNLSIHNYGKYVDGFQLASAYFNISGVYSHLKNYKLAFQYQREYAFLSDSIFNLKKSKEFDALRTEYEVEKKNNRINLLETENQLSATKRRWLVISSILLSIPLLVLFLFYRHRAKNLRTIRIQEQEIYKKEKLRLLKEQELAEVKALIKGQDKERHRIANELHDGIGGQLASVTMGLSYVNSNLNNSDISVLGKMLSNTFDELRELSHSLSYNHLKNKTLEVLIAELKTQFESTNSFIIEVSIYPYNVLNNLELIIKHNLYRILQEVLTNCAKYSNAKLIQLSFNKHGDVLVIMIEDDGIGFDLEKNINGIGLKNIQERVNVLVGTFNMESTISLGTHIIIEIPINITN